jgi:branched-chain amino acid transport system ATP-binding protein
MSEALLELTDVRAGFGTNTVLHGVALRVDEGEMVGVFGLNGAGKSVTMKVIAGIVPAWSGTVRFLGDDVTKLTAEQRVARGMGHVPQGRQVFPELTVEQNLRLGAYPLRRRDKGRYQSVLDGVLDRFPILAERRKQMAGTMSGGQQASLAVARALMSDPKLVLVDEASAGLAPIVVEELLQTLRDVNQSGVTVLMVEQNVAFGLQTVERAYIMQRGRCVYDAAVGELDSDRVASELGIGRLLSAGVGAATGARTATSVVAAAAGVNEPAPAKRAPRKRTAAPVKKAMTATKKKAAVKKVAAAKKAATKTATKKAAAAKKTTAKKTTRKAS